MTTIAIYLPTPERARWWVEHLGELLPEYTVTHVDDVQDRDAVNYVVTWRPPEGMLASFPQLRATISVGAGYDHITADTKYPRHVPIIKTIGPHMTQRMCEYVALQVLRFHRELPSLEDAQRSNHWQAVLTPTAAERTIGVMGLGDLGRAVATMLNNFGFDVSGWSTSGCAPEGVKGYSLKDLPSFLAQTEILVCLLPLNPHTENILNAKTLAQLPRGARLINVARGAHLDEQALLDALDNGHLNAATLDVFRTEPLPENHPFWSHPNILVTPHLASIVDPVSGGTVIADNIRRLENGERLEHVARI